MHRLRLLAVTASIASLAPRAGALLPLPLVEGFESGGERWESDGDWTVVSSAAHQGLWCATDSPIGNYVDGTDYTFMLDEPIDLSGTTLPTLQFWDRYTLTHYDRGLVEMSIDERETWRVVHEHYLFTNLDWAHRVADLRELAGNERVWLRFRLDARSHSNTADGWYVDDIKLFDRRVPVRATPVVDGFEDGGLDWMPDGDWAVAAEAAAAGSLGFCDSPGANYIDGGNHTLTSGFAVDLSQALNPRLSFDDRYDLTHYDRGVIEISTDLGWTWEPVFDHYLFSNADWHRRTVNLDLYRGEGAVMVRFRLDARSHSNTAAGWSIDNIAFRDAPLVTITPPGSDSFECRTDGWEIEGDWAITTVADAYVGTHVLDDSPGGNYIDGGNHTATLAYLLDLRRARSPRLVFWDHFDLTHYDKGVAEISRDFGETWEEVFSHYLASNPDWARRTVDLSPFVGEGALRLRFRLDARSHSNTADGWTIDSVRLEEREHDPPFSVLLLPKAEPRVARGAALELQMLVENTDTVPRSGVGRVVAHLPDSSVREISGETQFRLRPRQSVGRSFRFAPAPEDTLGVAIIEGMVETEGGEPPAVSTLRVLIEE